MQLFYNKLDGQLSNDSALIKLSLFVRAKNELSFLEQPVFSKTVCQSVNASLSLVLHIYHRDAAAFFGEEVVIGLTGVRVVFRLLVVAFLAGVVLLFGHDVNNVHVKFG